MKTYAPRSCAECGGEYMPTGPRQVFCDDKCRRANRCVFVPGVKACSKCGETKSTEEFTRKPGKPGGVDSRCRSCVRPSERAYEERNRERRNGLARAREAASRAANPGPRTKARARRAELAEEGLRECCRCGNAKPIAGFYRRTRSRDGLSYECKDCKPRHSNSHNPETYRTYRLANRDRINEAKRRHYQKHGERLNAQRKRARFEYREESRDRIRARNEQYYDTHRYMYVAYSRARRKRLQAATAPLATLSGKRWTPAEDLIALREDVTLVELAVLLGRSHQSVSKRRTYLRSALATAITRRPE